MGDASAFDVLPCYQNLAIIGYGTYGEVCQADVVPGAARPDNAYFDRLEQGKPVAIKRLGRALVFRDGYHAKKVYREIVLLKQLIHDNVVKLLDLFISDARDIYIVTEKMDCDLSHLLLPEFEMTGAMVQYITYGIMRGLKYIHSAGVIHRDLKPSNILLNTSLDARICDFGLARGSSPETLATGYVTTRWYRAPEVMLTWRHYTAALDMWSVGCILGEMLNKVRNYVTATQRDPNTERVLPLYALFPAESHVDHLEKILHILGPPSPEVVASTTDSHIATFLRDKVEQQQGTTTSVESYFHNVDADAAGLIAGLLNFNPRLRYEAAHALEHAYLSKYHEPSEEAVRAPIDRSFEALELSADNWAHMIQRAVNTMGVVQAGEAGRDHNRHYHAAHHGVQPGPEEGLLHLDALSHDDDDAHHDQAALEALGASFDLDLPERVPSLFADNELTTTISGLEDDRRFLHDQLMDDDDDADTQRILQGITELDAELDLVQQRPQPPPEQ